MCKLISIYRDVEEYVNEMRDVRDSSFRIIKFAYLYNCRFVLDNLLKLSKRTMHLYIFIIILITGKLHTAYLRN